MKQNNDNCSTPPFKNLQYDSVSCYDAMGRDIKNATNLGTGIGIFDGKFNDMIGLRTFSPGDASVVITLDTVNKLILTSVQISASPGNGLSLLPDGLFSTSGGGGGGTVTSVDLTAGTGISVAGGPITTAGSITVINTAPDQVVSITGGTGISATGTYPNFTITNTAPSTVTPSALTKVDDTNVTLTLGGTPATALLQSVILTLGWTGTLADARIASATTWNNKVTSLTAGTGISITGTTTVPIVTNTLPDQTVVLTSGTGISITGTYPSFTITNSSPSSGGTVTSIGITGNNGISVASSPVTTSGNIVLGLGAITPTSVNGITLSGSGSLANSGTSSLTGFTGSGTSSGTNTGDITISDTSTINLSLTGQALSADAITQMSITSDASGLKLSGDASSPGNLYRYATDSSGTKGWSKIDRVLFAYSRATTATTNSTSNLIIHEITIPAGYLGANDSIEVVFEYSASGNAGTKTWQVRYGSTSGTLGTTYLDSGSVAASNNSGRYYQKITCKNSTSSQEGARLTSGYGTTTAAMITSSINTANASYIQIACQKSTGTDTVSVNNYEIYINRV